MKFYWLLILIFAAPLCAQDDLDELLSLSLEELLQVNISDQPALTKLSSVELPASITVITAEDIKHTPARNILDLIETYVPGAIWMNYEESPQIGIRGIITDRNYKYLLRVNGRLMNNKGEHGAKSELEQWQLSDIYQIEIVRGPGSVIYGPGAIGGVINITTHTADTFEGLDVSSGYTHTYNSQNVTIRHGYNSEKIKSFSYASITQTQGYNAPHFIGTNNQTAGYVGVDILTDSEPLDYFADFDDRPQIKLHWDLGFSDNWRIWARYTQQGSTWRGNEVKTVFNEKMLNQQGVNNRQWAATLTYDNDIRENISFSALLSADSLDIERRIESLDLMDPDHALNKKFNFSETEMLFRSVINWQASETIEIAFGSEYSWDQFGPGWGDDKKDMRLGEDGTIVSGPDSNAMLPGSGNSADKNGSPIFVDGGWNTSTYSFFAEGNWTISSWLKLVLSGRVDKNSFSDWLFSPRLALVSKFAEGHHINLIAQKSRRMATAGQLYTLNVYGNDPQTETIDAVEFVYSAHRTKPLSFRFATFWNETEIIAWDGTAQASNMVGVLWLYGIEPEISYRWKTGKIAINYSFVKQIDWQLAEGVSASGISYSDYNQPLGGSTGIQTGVGNDLNNWPNQSLKGYARTTLLDKLTLHVDARLTWDYQGAKDGLTGLTNAIKGLPQEAVVAAAIDRVNDVGTYDSDFRLNASLNYEFNDKLSIQLFAQNLLGVNGNKRYAYDTSNNKASPKRVRFTEEPGTIGLTLRYVLK